MAFRFLDRASQAVGSAAGLGSITLGGPLAGYQTLAQAGIHNFDTFSYLVVDGTNWEYGVGTWTNVGIYGTVARTTITNTSDQSTNPIVLTSRANVSAILRAEDISTVSKLEGLADVTVDEATLSDGQVLSWNVGAGKWQAVTPGSGGGGTSLATLSDVSVTEGAGINGYTLNWSQSLGKWIAVVPVTGGSASTGVATGRSTAQAVVLPPLTHLPDVQITTGSGVDGYSITWNDTDKRFELANVSGGGGGGSALAILNNGSSVDTAAISLNFINATSITTSAHDVVITLPAGGGGGGTYDLSAGVPALSGMTQVNNTNQTFHESAGKAINMKTVTSESNVICGARLAVPGSTPYRVAIFLQSSTGVTGHCLVAGFTDGTKYAVILLKDDGNFWVYGFSTSSSPDSALLASTVNASPREIWLGLRNDGTNIFYEISADGVNFQTIYTETISGGYLSSGYTNIVWGHIAFGTGPQSVTLRCYDVAGLTRSFP